MVIITPNGPIKRKVCPTPYLVFSLAGACMFFYCMFFAITHLDSANDSIGLCLPFVTSGVLMPFFGTAFSGFRAHSQYS